MKNKIILVPFPFDDLSSSKVRPAVCLTDEISKHKQVIIAFITSQLPVDILESDLLIESNSIAFNKTGLKVSSTIRLHKMVCISTKIIQRELGILNENFSTEINFKLKKIFDLH